MMTKVRAIQNKLIQISLRLLVCLGIVQAMQDNRPATTDQYDLAGQIRVLRLLREEQLSSSESRRKWGKILEQRFKEVFGMIDLESSVVVDEWEVLSVSGEQLTDGSIKPMVITPSRRSAFKPYKNPQK